MPEKTEQEGNINDRTPGIKSFVTIFNDSYL